MDARADSMCEELARDQARPSTLPTASLRLVGLAKWSDFCTDGQETTAAMMTHLIHGAAAGWLVGSAAAGGVERPRGTPP
jgi:hypothetical protein